MADTTFSVPAPIKHFFSKFPIYTYPSIDVASARNLSNSTQSELWIAPPRAPANNIDTNTNDHYSLLSADVECLKWQAYIALRGVRDVRVRWDVPPEGGVDARLPSLLVVRTGAADLREARAIPAWVDDVLGRGIGELEGYKNEQARDESRAWVALLEGVVHAALLLSLPKKMSLKSLLFYTPSSPGDKDALASVLSPPPAPITGLTTLLPPYGARVSISSIQAQYHDAIVSLSDRLGGDDWFLGSTEPTALDALAFAYLHCLLGSTDDVRIDVARRENLVSWTQRVQAMVEVSFVASSSK